MLIHRPFAVALLAGAIAVVPGTSASAATSDTASSVSANWAGYVVGNASSSDGFSRVSGSWVQPTVDCSQGSGDSAFWVGLGGTSSDSSSLEQDGTEADCNGSGQATYFAWYELVPSAPVQLNLTISPGDHISSSVSVSGDNVTVTVTDDTTGASTTKTLQMDDPDTSSAEWIAEAPSECDGSGACDPLALADFGTVNFSNASATAGGHTGTISDSQWSAQSVDLDGGGYGVGGGGGYETPLFSGGSSASASPSSLSSGGNAFSVSWQSSDQSDPSQSTTGAGAGTTGSGAGSGAVGSGGYGGGSAYGDGSGGYGDGSGGYGGYGDGGYGYGAGGYYGGGSAYGDGGGGYGYGGGSYGDGGYGAGGYYGGGYGYDGYSGAAYGYGSL